MLVRNTPTTIVSATESNDQRGELLCPFLVDDTSQGGVSTMTLTVLTDVNFEHRRDNSSNNDPAAL